MSILNILELVELLKTIAYDEGKVVDYEVTNGGVGVWAEDKNGCMHYYGFIFDDLPTYEEDDAV